MTSAVLMLFVACASVHVGVDAHGMLRVPTSVRNDIRAPGEGCAGDPPANKVSKTASLNHAFSSASIYHHNQTSQGTGCCGGGCIWFSQPANVDHPTLPHFARTMNPGVGGGPGDYSRYRPWRSPGAAPVLGSGCGAAGGGPMRLANGGNAPFVYKQGADAMDALPPKEPAVWTAGSEQDVAWAITANHGGGYSLRLCKLEPSEPREGVTEECFQRTPLRFSTDAANGGAFSRIVNASAPHEPPTYVKRVTVSEGTVPAGSEWARNPIPSCSWCEGSRGVDETAQRCGMEYGLGELPPQEGTDIESNPWLQQVVCLSDCAGADFGSFNTSSPRPQGCAAPSTTQFPEPQPGASGFVGQKSLEELLIYDTVVVPEHLEPGRYLLGWRWDCEQSSQVWQVRRRPL